MLKRLVQLFVAGAATAALISCGSSSDSASTAKSFTLSEFVIAPPVDLSAGNVEVTAENVGSEDHELVIVAANNPNELPTKADGSVDEAKIPAEKKVLELRDVASRSRQAQTVDLKSGTYVAYCNLIEKMAPAGSSEHGSGHGSGETAAETHIHFARGMAAAFNVK
jgi:hypothetical protein